MASGLSDLKEQIEKARESLKSVDENIKKITGRDPNEPRPITDGRRLSGGGPRSREFGGVLGRRNRDAQENSKDSEPPRKRAVFSRLGPAAGGRRVVLTGRRASKQEEENDGDEDEEEEEKDKPAVQSSVVSTAKKITKSELISAQNVGEKGKARNRRMFGMLLGTLARFDKDSQGQPTKQAKKQREVETRLEEENAEERRKLASQRRTLFNERRSQQRRISLLEQKVALADELVEWEKEWNKKSNFIKTKATPSIFFMPKDFTPRTQRALQESKERIKETIEKSRKSVEETMNDFDDEIRFLDGKHNNEDGKRDKNDQGRNQGSRAGNSHRRGVRDDEPEEEMDLDSMEPQVDIKVEMDDNEGDVEPDVVGNGAHILEIEQEVGNVQHPDEQNHDSTTKEGNVGHTEESGEDGDNPHTTAKERSVADTVAHVVHDELTKHELDDKLEDSVDKIPKEEVKRASGDEEVGHPSFEDEKEAGLDEMRGNDNPHCEDSQFGKDTKDAVKSGVPDSAGMKGPVGLDATKWRKDVLPAESNDEKVLTNTATSRAETASQVDGSKGSSYKTVPDGNSPSSNDSADEKSQAVEKTSTEAFPTRREVPADKAETKESTRNRRTESSSSLSEKERKDGMTKSEQVSGDSSVSDSKIVKAEAKESVRRKNSASERKAKMRKRKQTHSSESESSDSSSSSSEDDRRKKRSSRSRRDDASPRRRSRERQTSSRSSGSRRRSRSRSRDRLSNRRDRQRR